MDPLTLGTLLVAPPSEDDDSTFGRTVVLIVDREPAWTITGLVLNRSLGTPAIDEAARAARAALDGRMATLFQSTPEP